MCSQTQISHTSSLSHWMREGNSLVRIRIAKESNEKTYLWIRKREVSLSLSLSRSHSNAKEQWENKCTNPELQNFFLGISRLSRWFCLLPQKKLKRIFQNEKIPTRSDFGPLNRISELKLELQTELFILFLFFSFIWRHDSVSGMRNNFTRAFKMLPAFKRWHHQSSNA